MKRKNDRKRLAVLLACVLVLSVCFGCGKDEKEKSKIQSLKLWYTEDEMAGYLESAAEDYQKKTGVHITCERKDSKQYVDDIYQASMEGSEEMPDLYLIRNDKLGRVCMEGLAAANTFDSYEEKNYCKAALQAAAFQDKQMAYPLYYNTACFICNAEYFQEAPATMGAITNFSETAEINENIQYILYWDSSDYFCNYPFIGNYLDINGSAGDDRDSISIMNDKTVACLQQFQEIGQYFAIDGTTLGSEDVPAAFIEGRILCVLSDCGMVHKISEYAAAQETPVTYQVSAVPNVSDDLQSCAGSYTELTVVNGLSLKQEEAAAFAEFLTNGYAENLYEKTGHFAAKQGITYQDDKLSELYKIYEQSKQFPKIPETEDLHVNLEILFANVRKGSDITTELQSFSDKIELRLNK